MYLCLAWHYPQITLVVERKVMVADTKKFWVQLVWASKSNIVDDTTHV